MAAHYEPPHQDLRCFQIQLFSSLALKVVIKSIQANMSVPAHNGLVCATEKDTYYATGCNSYTCITVCPSVRDLSLV